MITLSPGSVTSVAVVGAHCDDIAIGLGATLLTLTAEHPGVVVNALVLTGAGTEREIEEKDAFAAMCGTAEVRLTVADLPDGRLPRHWAEVKAHIADFRRTCDPDMVFGPQRGDRHQDHRLLAELIPTEFRDHLTLGYEILKWESDLPMATVYRPIAPDVARTKVRLLSQCYRSQRSRDWFDDETFLGLMRVRGVQCHSRYAEAFVAEKAVLDFGRSDRGHL
jgi:LmbE family N-acetylglucosaminyl deacetylase